MCLIMDMYKSLDLINKYNELKEFKRNAGRICLLIYISMCVINHALSQLKHLISLIKRN